MAGHEQRQKTQPLEMIMKTIATALIALSVLAGTVAPSFAAETFSIKQLDQQGRSVNQG
jgi:hypothetical protein